MVKKDVLLRRANIKKIEQAGFLTLRCFHFDAQTQVKILGQICIVFLSVRSQNHVELCGTFLGQICEKFNSATLFFLAFDIGLFLFTGHPISNSIFHGTEHIVATLLRIIKLVLTSGFKMQCKFFLPYTGVVISSQEWVLLGCVF